MGVSRRKGKLPREDCGRRRCSTSGWESNSTGCAKEGCPRGASSKGAYGGAAVKMEEERLFDGNRGNGLELPIAFSSLNRDKKWDAQIPKAA